MLILHFRKRNRKNYIQKFTAIPKTVHFYTFSVISINVNVSFLKNNEHNRNLSKILNKTK